LKVAGSGSKACEAVLVEQLVHERGGISAVADPPLEARNLR
jgi:hypothetical protein